MRTPLVIILSMCAHRAHQACRTGHQSSLSLPSMLRAENPLLSAAVSLYTMRMPMPLHNYRVSIRQVHRCVFASVPSKRNVGFRSSGSRVSRLLVDFFLETWLRVIFSLVPKSSLSHCSLCGKSDMIKYVL